MDWIIVGLDIRYRRREQAWNSLTDRYLIDVTALQGFPRGRSNCKFKIQYVYMLIKILLVPSVAARMTATQTTSWTSAGEHPLSTPSDNSVLGILLLIAHTVKYSLG